jgi:hypothetical protein
MRPRSIELFEKVYIAAIAIGLVNLVVSWNQIGGMLESPEAQAAGMGPGFLVGISVVSLIISLLLWYFIARRASNVAKWIYVVLTAIGLFGVLSSLANPLAPKGLAMILSLAATALQVFAAWLLFKPDAKAWLESKGADGPADPSTFE